MQPRIAARADSSISSRRFVMMEFNSNRIGPCLPTARLTWRAPLLPTVATRHQWRHGKLASAGRQGALICPAVEGCGHGRRPGCEFRRGCAVVVAAAPAYEGGHTPGPCSRYPGQNGGGYPATDGCGLRSALSKASRRTDWRALQEAEIVVNGSDVSSLRRDIYRPSMREALIHITNSRRFESGRKRFRRSGQAVKYKFLTMPSW